MYIYIIVLLFTKYQDVKQVEFFDNIQLNITMFVTTDLLYIFFMRASI